jgi:CubicO group peptidase (beta-lactamase class C family)
VAFDAATEVVEKASGRPYAEELRRQLFDPIGMTSASATRAGLQSAPRWARGHTVGRRPIEVNDVYYGVPAAGGVNSNIKDMSLWMLAQMGEMPAVLSPQLLQTIQAPRVPTPNQRGRMRKFLERLAEPHRRTPRRGQRLSLADPVRPSPQKRGRRLVEQQYQPTRRPGVRSDGHGLSLAVPRLDGAGQESRRGHDIASNRSD